MRHILGRVARQLLEESVEMSYRVETAFRGDFVDLVFAAFYHRYGVLYAYMVEIVGEGRAGLFLEHSGKIRFAVAERACGFSESNVGDMGVNEA